MIQSSCSVSDYFTCCLVWNHHILSRYMSNVLMHLIERKKKCYFTQGRFAVWSTTIGLYYVLQHRDNEGNYFIWFPPETKKKSWWSVYIVIACSLLPCKVYFFLGNHFQLNINRNTMLGLQFTWMMTENFPQTCFWLHLFLLHYSYTSCADWQWTSTLWSDLWPYNVISKSWMI